MYTEVFSSDGQIVFNLLSIVYLNRHMCIFIAGQTNYLAENFQEYKNHNNQVMETTKMPHYWWMDQENVVLVHNGILLSREEEWNLIICR
jgi:hypothetical protein